MSERRDLAAAMPTVARKLFGEPVKALSSAREYRYGRKGSLSIDTEKGTYFDHESGVGGGVIDLIRREMRCDLRGALQWLENTGEHVPVVRPIESGRERPATSMRDLGLKLWREASDPIGTLANRYLLNRGLPGAAGFDAIRFHSRCPFGKGADGRTRNPPAMLALMRSVIDGEPVGVHRTELTSDGRKVERKMLGPAAGAAVMLSAINEYDCALGICEGIETGMAILAMGGGPVWARLSAGSIASFPVLYGITELTIYADNDPAGMKAGREAGARYTAAGIPAKMVVPKVKGHDFLDDLRARRQA